MTQAICDITTDEVNVDVVVEPQADTMVEVANRAGGMEQVFHDNTLIGNGNSIDLGVNTDLIATKEYVDEKVESIDTYTKDQIDGKLTAVDAQIDANADAIQKTREDYIQADSEIHQILNNHAENLTTLHNDVDDLGEQVANIESKIPDGTSDTNPLINKQQLLDEEMDIREDLNSGLSELQTQITAQAAEIATKQDQLTAGDNIIISGNVISATGSGTGFDVQVIQELPATGQKGIIYLLAKDGTTPDVYDEYVWIESTQSFELIGTTQVDLSDYVKNTDYATGDKAGVIRPSEDLGTNVNAYGYLRASIRTLEQYNSASNSTFIGKGTLENIKDDIVARAIENTVNTQNLTVGSGEGTLYVGDVAGTATIATNNGLDIAAQTKFDTAPTTDDTTAWADVNPTALVTKQQVVTAVSESGGGTSLPDQTDNAGKFLTTDGTTASWGASYAKSNYISWADTTHQQINIGTVDAASGAKTYGYAAIGATACGDYTVCILGNSKLNSNVCIGASSDTGNGSYVVAIGFAATVAGDTVSRGQIAIGYGAKTRYAKCAIQLGGNGTFDGYTNSDANTFKVGNANGNFEMMSADGTIPADRMSATAGTTGQVLTKTDTGMAWADASGGDGDIDCGVMS